MEALGRLIEVVPAGRVFVTGGLSGSGWPLGPSDFHMYWSLPKLIAEMAPEKKLREPPAPSNATLTGCEFDWSLLMSISDHWRRDGQRHRR